jgi:hypothetical protein
MTHIHTWDIAVSDLSVKIGVMRKYEYLLDEIAVDRSVTVVRIVSAYLNHLTYKRTNDEKTAAVHTGNRVIDYNDFISCFTILGIRCRTRDGKSTETQ